MTPSAIVLAAFRLEGLAGRWGWLWMALLLVGVAVLVWTYHGFYRRSGRPLAWGLLALRGAALVLLFLMLAKPTWTRAHEEVEPARVAIVLDTSQSMSLPDGTGTTRFERARQAVEELRHHLTQRTGAGPVAVDVFDLEGELLRELPGEPGAGFTDLGRGLRSTLAQTRSRRLAAVLLVSDGADTTGRPTFADWELTRVPIHTVGFADAVELDLAVRTPAAPRRVLKHNEMSVSVPVAKKGREAVQAMVRLRRGREVLASRKVELGPGDVEQVVALGFRPEQPGMFELTAEVESTVGERETANNAVNFPLEVVQDPIRVLYIEGFLRNEYTFLSRHFTENDPDVLLIRELRRIAPDGPGRRLPDGVLDEKTLEKIDVVLLGDLEGDYLSPDQYRALVRWLDGKNHSLLVLGGYESFGLSGLRTTPLADLLPVVFAGAAQSQSEKPFVLRLTEKGQTHPIFTVDADPVRSRKLWQEAEPLDGMPLVARAKPAADVLAVHPEVELEGRPAVALAVQRAPGGGQVMVLCPDTTWKWSRFARLRGGEATLYARFWSQTLRWLAGRAVEESRPLLSVRVGKAVHDVKSKVTVRVARQRRPGGDSSPLQVSVDITDPKGASVPGLVPRIDPADPDVATVEFYPATAGRYAVTAALKVEGKVVANQATELRVRGRELELADGTPRRENLEALAAATGGVYADIAVAGELAEKIPREERRVVGRIKRSEYWDSPWLFTAFLAAVTVEWILRRRSHLV